MADLVRTHLQNGDLAPSFEGVDQDGNSHQLSDYSQDKLVLFFYPKDNTPGCTAEVCNLRDNYAELLKAGYKLLGVSADTKRKHQNFISKFDLPFPLLADTDHMIINAYGVWGRKKFMGREFDGILRTTFVIEGGKIKQVFDRVKTSDHASQIMV
ncbi:MAG: thioredoxin-dependent thiol peroxidase [Saprospiraceae bacterium]|nr:thioredoxin-dependent thiol peroxidase [Saprospiraceae bacterium]